MSKGKVKVVEVGLRDGLQNETEEFSLRFRFQLVRRLIQAGLRHIEVGAFVSHLWVPQMRVTGDLVYKIFSFQKSLLNLREKIKKEEYSNFFSTSFSVLIPNEKGLEMALETPLKEVSFLISSSETFSKKNTNCSIQGSFLRLKSILKTSFQQSVKIRTYLSTSFGCPYEGRVSQAKVVSIIKRLIQMGVYEVSIGDTIGVATPGQVESLLQKIKKNGIDFDKLAMHFHDTRGTALANVYASIKLGVRKFDSSIGGLGGCPYAKGAQGNLATEDLIYMLKGMRINTGIDIGVLIKMKSWIEKFVKRPLPSHIGNAKLPIKGTIF